MSKYEDVIIAIEQLEVCVERLTDATQRTAHLVGCGDSVESDLHVAKLGFELALANVYKELLKVA